MSGGAPALYATVLQGDDIGDVLSRVQAVRRVLGVDRTAARMAGRTVAERAGAERRLGELAARRTSLQTVVAGRSDAVRTLLAETEILLTTADARIRALADEQRRAADAAAARSAAARLARARQETALTGLPVPPASGAAGRAVAAALSQLGKPYLWGGTGPDAFDCSGLTQLAYRAAGLALPRVANQQWSAGRRVALGDLQPGDLLFWADDPADPVSIHHVAMYVGDGRMVAAPHAGAVVRVQPVYLEGYAGAVRPTAAPLRDRAVPAR
jgi:cell wall-associated NlpC family hydrolase